MSRAARIWPAASMRATCDDHMAIWEAIQATNPDNASVAATTHIENGLAKSLAALDNAGDWAMSGAK